VLATVLAAVADAAGPEVSSTCSTFVSVKSSLDGVILAGGSDAISEVGGVFGISVESVTNGGSNPSIPVSVGFDGAAIEGSTGASWLGAARGVFGGAGAGAGLANMLAQLRVPSGFEVVFEASSGCLAAAAEGEVASAAETCSQEESRGVESV